MLLQHKRPSGNGTQKRRKINSGKISAVRIYLCWFFGKKSSFEWCVLHARKTISWILWFQKRQSPRVFLAHFVTVSTFGEGIDDNVPVVNWFWWTRKLKYFLQGGPLTSHKWSCNSTVFWARKTSCPFFPPFVGASHVTPFVKFVVMAHPVKVQNPQVVALGWWICKRGVPIQGENAKLGFPLFFANHLNHLQSPVFIIWRKSCLEKSSHDGGRSG